MDKTRKVKVKVEDLTIVFGKQKKTSFEIIGRGVFEERNLGKDGLYNRN